MIHAQVQPLRAIQATIRGVDDQIKERLSEHPRTQLLAALPGVGQINLAQLMAEVAPSWPGSTPPTRPPPNAASPR